MGGEYCAGGRPLVRPSVKESLEIIGVALERQQRPNVSREDLFTSTDACRLPIIDHKISLPMT